MSQEYINMLVLAFGALIGAIIKTIWASLKELQASDRKLADKVADIGLTVAGEYLKKADFDRWSSTVLEKLDKISDKLNKKEDKK